MRGNASAYGSIWEYEEYLEGLIWNNRQYRRYAVELLKTEYGLDFLRKIGKRGLLKKAYFSYLAARVNVVRHNKFFTVPKTSTTLRPCCKEASLSLMLQRGLGTVFRQRLKLHGIDLDKQDKYHEFLISYHSDKIATIDLSAASDSVNLNLLSQVLPSDWFELIRELRAQETLLPNGSIRHLSKVSSMGNGFTFELESLLFYACILDPSCQQRALPAWSDLGALLKNTRNVSVFGDDIIVAPDQFDRATRTLRLLGFTINLDKSHGYTSPLKESCGQFSLSGETFRLFSLKHLDSLQAIISARNRLFNLRHSGIYTETFCVLDRWVKKQLRARRVSYETLFCVSQCIPDTEVLYSDWEPATGLKRLQYPSQLQPHRLDRVGYALSLRASRHTKNELCDERSWRCRVVNR